MEHVLFFDGNTKRISWTIQTDNSIIDQKREHAEIYLDKVSNIQSKYIGLHIGLFWGIGTFIIKNEDIVKIATDDKSIFDHLTNEFHLLIQDHTLRILRVHLPSLRRMCETLTYVKL